MYPGMVSTLLVLANKILVFICNLFGMVYHASSEEIILLYMHTQHDIRIISEP